MMVLNGRHAIRMLCSATFRFKLLKASLAYTRITALVCSFANISYMEWIAAPVPFFNPVAVWRGPAVFCISSFSVQAIVLPMVQHSISPTPIGLTPGVLLRTNRQHATKASIDLGSTRVVAKFFDSNAIFSRRSFDFFLNFLLRLM